MNKIQFNFERSGLAANELKRISQDLIPEIQNINFEFKSKYNTPYAFAYAPFDNNILNHINDLVEQKKKLAPTILIVIGIGGSNLGTMAVHEAINGKLYNDKNPSLRVYFADTVDADYIMDIYSLVEAQLMLGNNVVINVISKSGSTIETKANFELFLKLIKKYKNEKFNELLVITTDKGSLLWDYAISNNCSVLEIPQEVGGRYSVFTAVGLFPLMMLSIDCKSLVQGACDITDNCLNIDSMKNAAVQNAAILYHHYKNGININNMFLFGVYLESLGKWFAQLMGESIGKELDLSGQKVELGITPTVSIGTIDLHSLGQLYLAGPKDKFTTFVGIEKGNNIEKSFSNIINAIFLGTQQAYFNKNRPFCSIIFKEKSAYEVGQFMQFNMYMIVYLASLLRIDPFNQPAVELYKNEAKKLLVKHP